ncbi:hypothetical protein AGJ34_21315 [Cronobacter dublinensis subsp. dublinensis]|nr:hypothetical protein [Cronobacter dublinensis subsp. dublinensis]EGT5671260.1 hypothetical protein [Cronobacter dublinensis subsp. dublinensis]EGT5675510.1 hypothetical protein [Cronobacter dublinensis subsp. dublinensis]EGT5679722.1 hypothetical protein [Cronobacter dublinensis subsp. dublinensis]EGT5687868.1 hypothetical protein [Cronobacter dublinensis subsp. dublinensis]
MLLSGFAPYRGKLHSCHYA